MTKSTCPEYAALATLADQEAFHAQIDLAQRDGAVWAERIPGAGVDTAIKRLKLRSLEALARHLGVQTLGDRCDAARHALLSWMSAYPVLGRIVEQWCHARTVRGHGPEMVGELVAALRVMDARRADGSTERILRRESVRLFGDSKRIEGLMPWLKILVTGELVVTGLSDEDAWASLGLRREPQPMLLAGQARLRVDGQELPLVRPYLGVPMASLQAVTTEARFLLSIENLASFHDAAQAMADAPGMLVYTGGMPSPAWRGAYALLLQAMPMHARILHWGDIDEGGFRIAASLSAYVASAGRVLQPWQMSPADVPADVREMARLPGPVALASMLSWCERAGWPGLAANLKDAPLQLEQEWLDPCWPDWTPAVRAGS